MGIGRTSHHPSTGRRCPGQAGKSLVEVSLVMGILGILGALGIATLDFGSADLVSVGTELQGSMDQAFTLARASGRDVKVALGGRAAANIIPVHVSPRIKWGRPAHIPLPPGMAETVRAEQTGEAHRQITVTPRRTVVASAWFLHDGREAVCMRVNGHGQVKLLRWSRYSRTWNRV